MIVIRDKDFKKVSTSRNLRGVFRYPASVARIDVWPTQMGVTWHDGASTIFDIGSPAVMLALRWVKQRIDTVTIHTKEN